MLPQDHSSSTYSDVTYIISLKRGGIKHFLEPFAKSSLGSQPTNSANWQALCFTNMTTDKTGLHQQSPNPAGHDTKGNRSTNQQHHCFPLPPTQPQAASCCHKHKGDAGRVLPKSHGWGGGTHGVMPKSPANNLVLFYFLWVPSDLSSPVTLPKLTHSSFVEIKSHCNCSPSNPSQTKSRVAAAFLRVLAFSSERARHTKSIRIFLLFHFTSFH